MITKGVAALIAIVAFFIIFRGLIKRASDTRTQAVTKQKASLGSRNGSRKDPAHSQDEKTGADYVDEYQALSGAADRAKEIPGWALLLHSPFNPPANPTSWIGGRPHAPEEFTWPSTTKGVRQHFLAQIDLSTLSNTGNNGLPSAGALLVFFSYQWTNDAPDHVYTCRILSADEMKKARPVPVPDDLDTLDKTMGFFHPEQTFIKRGVDLVPFQDDRSSPPAGIPNNFTSPERWISNWGIALADVEITLQRLQHCVEPLLADKGQKHLADLNARFKKMPQAKYLLSDIANTKALASQGPEMLEALTAWRDLARSRPANAPIDLNALKALFAKRTALAEQMKPGIAAVLKEGAHEDLWRQVQ